MKIEKQVGPLVLIAYANKAEAVVEATRHDFVVAFSRASLLKHMDGLPEKIEKIDKGELYMSTMLECASRDLLLIRDELINELMKIPDTHQSFRVILHGERKHLYDRIRDEQQMGQVEIEGQQFPAHKRVLKLIQHIDKERNAAYDMCFLLWKDDRERFNKVMEGKFDLDFLNKQFERKQAGAN